MSSSFLPPLAHHINLYFTLVVLCISHCCEHSELILLIRHRDPQSWARTARKLMTSSWSDSQKAEVQAHVAGKSSQPTFGWVVLSVPLPQKTRVVFKDLQQMRLWKFTVLVLRTEVHIIVPNLRRTSDSLNKLCAEHLLLNQTNTHTHTHTYIYQIHLVLKIIAPHLCWIAWLFVMTKHKSV